MGKLAWRGLVASLCLWSAGIAVGQPYQPRAVRAKVPDYVVAPDLSNVVNRAAFNLDATLTPERRALLVANGFVARPTRGAQMWDLYSPYTMATQPPFVSSDCVLHAYHVVSESLLMYMELTRLSDALADMSEALTRDALSAYDAEPADSPAKEVLGRSAAYLAVPCLMFGRRPPLDAPTGAVAMADVGRVMASRGRGRCGLGTEVDFGQFVPRGHYTRSPALSTYFRAMMWYGQMTMPLDNGGTIAPALTLAELLNHNPRATAAWRDIDALLTLLVGPCDDLTPAELQPVINQVFGDGPPRRFCDVARQRQFAALAGQALRGPRVEQASPMGGAQSRQLRLMGQRYLPDSRIFQELCEPKVRGRSAPMGLDVPAVLGSQRASSLLTGLGQDAMPEYLDQRARLQREFGAMTTDAWTATLASGWLWALQPLLKPAGEGYPQFMRRSAWDDKQLVTMLGSWTELRHDLVLYAKPSSGGLGGNGGPSEPAPGYVEPVADLYDRLAWLLRHTDSELRRHGALGPDQQFVARLLSQFAKLCGQLAVISVRQLSMEPLSEAEKQVCRTATTDLLGLVEEAKALVTSMGARQSGPVTNPLALVADVHTMANGHVLVEAVGAPAELLVVAPYGGQLHLFRGATYTQYEFDSSTRLTDEAWRARLSNDQAPPLAAWLASYLQPLKAPSPAMP